MDTPLAPRSAMAIVRVEVQDAGARLLIRVTTVDDVTQREPAGPGEPFSDPAAALEHLRVWLARWLEKP